MVQKKHYLRISPGGKKLLEDEKMSTVDVLLIVPPDTEHMKAPAQEYLGLEYLASFLRHHAYTVGLLNCSLNVTALEAAEAADTKKTLEPSRPMTRTAPSLKRASSALPSISIVPPQKRIPLTKRRNSSRGGKKIRKTKKRC